MGKIYTIMGATGQIGRVLTEELLKKGHKVRALGRDEKKLKALQAKGAEIHVIDFERAQDLIMAFKGSDAVFSFIPPGYGQDNYDQYQDKVGEAIYKALQETNIPYCVNLSSLGAELEKGTGPIKGLHRHEERLNRIHSLNVLHLRPGYFMQNLFDDMPTISSDDAIYCSIKGDLEIPMIHTDDIGRKAAEFLDKLQFKEKTVFEFVGPKPISFTEATKILSKAIGKQEIKFIQLNYDQHKKAMNEAGMNNTLVDLFIEMHKAINQGLAQPKQKLTLDHVGKIRFEDFAKEYAKAFSEREAAIQ
jgi:uncharacterized protein YbjT (DUF2867 family)